MYLVIYESETLGFRIANMCIRNMGLCKQSSEEYMVIQYSTLEALIQSKRSRSIWLSVWFTRRWTQIHRHYHLNVEFNLNKVIGLILLFLEANAIKVAADQLSRSIHFLLLRYTKYQKSDLNIYTLEMENKYKRLPQPPVLAIILRSLMNSLRFTVLIMLTNRPTLKLSQV